MQSESIFVNHPPLFDFGQMLKKGDIRGMVSSNTSDGKYVIVPKIELFNYRKKSLFFCHQNLELKSLILHVF
jgi:hypothetical protein